MRDFKKLLIWSKGMDIAEGNSRVSVRDKKRFIEIALGSAFELEIQVLISQNLNISENSKLDQLVVQIREEQKLISSFIRLLTEEIQ
jgi:four helix bundle protein